MTGSKRARYDRCVERQQKANAVALAFCFGVAWGLLQNQRLLLPALGVLNWCAGKRRLLVLLEQNEVVSVNEHFFINVAKQRFYLVAGVTGNAAGFG